MSHTYSASVSAQVNGRNYSRNTTGSFEENKAFDLTLPAATAVTNWVKTDSDTAACDLTAGHGLASGNYDVYWSVAGVNYCRYGVAVTITSNSAALDGGSGTAFPASSTTGITIAERVVRTFAADASQIQFMLFAIASATVSARASVDFLDGSNASVTQKLLETDSIGSAVLVANSNFSDVANGGTNLFGTTDIASFRASSGITTACTLTIVVGESG